MIGDDHARSRTAGWASAFVAELASAGVRDVCIAPGSRSTPLVMACVRHPELRLYSHIDERSAAFFALGLARTSGRVPAVVTTSGTAAANLLPAAVEAFRSEAPLLLLTADRPPAYRHADANQAIDQQHLYGRHVRDFVDVGMPSSDAGALRHLRAVAARAVATARGRPAGPVHLNLPFAKPLEPPDAADPDDILRSDSRIVSAPGETGPSHSAAHIVAGRLLPDAAALESLAETLASTRRAFIVCGPVPDPAITGPAVRRLAAALDLPLLADPLSGARYGAGAERIAVGTYDVLLADAGLRTALGPELVLRFGASPTSASLNLLLEELSGVRHVVVDAGDRWKDHLSVATDYLRADPSAVCEALLERCAGKQHSHPQHGDPQHGDPQHGRNGLEPDGGHGGESFAGLWRRAERTARDAMTRAAGPDRSEPDFEGALLAGTVDALPEGAHLLVSNSMPVRDLDAFVPPRDAPLAVLANRGASGIDGIVSTALGAAAGMGSFVDVGPEAGTAAAPAAARDAEEPESAPAAGPLVAVMGDLALYHDMNGLLAVRRHGIRVVLVVINNDGGGIFHMLPIREFEPAFTDYFATPHGLDFADAAKLYDIPYERVRGRAALEEAVREALAAPDSRMIEVTTDREGNRRHRAEVTAAVQRAVVAELGDRVLEESANSPSAGSGHERD